MKNPPYKIIAGDEYLLKSHKELIELCDKYNATCDLATSDINIFIQHCSEELKELIKQIPQYKDASYWWWNTNELEIS